MGPKICVVTELSRCIGGAIAERFREEEFEVLVNYRSSGDAAEEVVTRIERAGGSAIPIRADVTDVDHGKQMRDQVWDGGA